MLNKTLKEIDLKHIWHPCTQMKDYEFLPLIPIKRGKGIYLYDFEDKKYIDAISSWWVNLFGHSNSYINNKIIEQLKDLEHVILAGFTHEPAIKLASKLVKLTPNGLNRVFYADNGSSAVEIALKMSYHYFKNIGEYRDTFLSLTNSYHGETIGALSVGDVKLYKETYNQLLIKNMQTPVPKDKTIEAAKNALKSLEEILHNNKNISALIVEPLIQGAGNMHMYHPLFLKGARELTKKYNIHLIVDEIMTGFGRTGTMFACEQANYNEHKAFLHSHSYTGNPLACSAALATLDIFENENIILKNQEKIAYMHKWLSKFKELDNINSIRQTGMVAAFDINGYKPEDRIGLQVYTYGLQHGVLLRPLGNTIYFMPPYIITNKEIDKMFTVAYD